jgi:hypothetical protein
MNRAGSKRHYKSGDEIDQVRSRLLSLIECKAEDNLKTHLQQTFLFKNEGKLLGSVDKKLFNVWIHEQGRSGATGIFYPVMYGQFTAMTDGTGVNLDSNMNIVGKLALIVISALISCGLVTGIVIQEDNSIEYLIPRLLISMALLTLMMSVPLFIYFRTSRVIKNRLALQLGLELIESNDD